MTKITENEIELFAIELLEKQGFEYIYAPNIASDKNIKDYNTPRKSYNKN